MHYRLFTMLLLSCSSVFGQQNDPLLRPGVQLSSVFSRNDEYGITPSFTLDYRRFSLSVGPRFSYERLFEGKPAYGSAKLLIIDAGLRYFPVDSWTKIRPFVQLVAEYERDNDVSARYFPANTTYPNGPVFDHSFDGEWETTRVSFNLCGGLGAEVPLWKELYLVAGGGLGAGFLQWESTVTNMSNGDTEYTDSKKWHYRGISWIASAGCGYRF